MNKKTDIIKMYMCNIAFEDELGYDSDGTTIYPSIKALRRAHKCVDSCGGIVEVHVTWNKTTMGVQDLTDEQMKAIQESEVPEEYDYLNKLLEEEDDTA